MMLFCLLFAYASGFQVIELTEIVIPTDDLRKAAIFYVRHGGWEIDAVGKTSTSFNKFANLSGSISEMTLKNPRAANGCIRLVQKDQVFTFQGVPLSYLGVKTRALADKQQALETDGWPKPSKTQPDAVQMLVHDNVPLRLQSTGEPVEAGTFYPFSEVTQVQVASHLEDQDESFFQYGLKLVKRDNKYDIRYEHSFVDVIPKEAGEFYPKVLLRFRVYGLKELQGHLIQQNFKIVKLPKEVELEPFGKVILMRVQLPSGSEVELFEKPLE